MTFEKHEIVLVPIMLAIVVFFMVDSIKQPKNSMPRPVQTVLVCEDKSGLKFGTSYDNK